MVPLSQTSTVSRVSVALPVCASVFRLCPSTSGTELPTPSGRGALRARTFFPRKPVSSIRLPVTLVPRAGTPKVDTATTFTTPPENITFQEEEEEKEVYEAVVSPQSLEAPLGGMISPDQAFIALNIAALLYGTNASSVKALVDMDIPPSEVSVVRFMLAAACLLPLLTQGGKRSERFWPIAAELGTYLAVGFGTQTQELLTTTASEGSVLLALYLVLVPIIETLTGIPYTRGKAACLAASVAGIALLIGGGGDPAAAGEAAAHAPDISGVALGIVSSVFFAAHLVRSEALQKEAGKDVALPLAAAQTLACLLFMTLWEGWEVGAGHHALSADGLAALPWAQFFLCSVLCTGLCTTMELVSVSAVPASTASLTLSMLIPYGIICGVVLQGDTLSPAGILGSLLIVGAGIGPKIADWFASRSATAFALEEIGPSAVNSIVAMPSVEAATEEAAAVLAVMDRYEDEILPAEAAEEAQEPLPVEERLVGASATTATIGASFALPSFLLGAWEPVAAVAARLLPRGLGGLVPAAASDVAGATTAATTAAMADAAATAGTIGADVAAMAADVAASVAPVGADAVAAAADVAAQGATAMAPIADTLVEGAATAVDVML